MVKPRDDAWSTEQDIMIAEHVLKHIRTGSTQTVAFEEAGTEIGRTAAAVGFRWNSKVRKKYEDAIKLAKQQNMNRKRAEKQITQHPPMKSSGKGAGRPAINRLAVVTSSAVSAGAITAEKLGELRQQPVPTKENVASISSVIEQMELFYGLMGEMLTEVKKELNEIKIRL